VHAPLQLCLVTGSLVATVTATTGALLGARATRASHSLSANFSLRNLLSGWAGTEAAFEYEPPCVRAVCPKCVCDGQTCPECYCD
jgi:hypothetical protein